MTEQTRIIPPNTLEQVQLEDVPVGCWFQHGQTLYRKIRLLPDMLGVMRAKDGTVGAARVFDIVAGADWVQRVTVTINVTYMEVKNKQEARI